MIKNFYFKNKGLGFTGSVLDSYFEGKHRAVDNIWIDLKKFQLFFRDLFGGNAL